MQSRHFLHFLSAIIFILTPFPQVGAAKKELQLAWLSQHIKRELFYLFFLGLALVATDGWPGTASRRWRETPSTAQRCTDCESQRWNIFGATNRILMTFLPRSVCEVAERQPATELHPSKRLCQFQWVGRNVSVSQHVDSRKMYIATSATMLWNQPIQTPWMDVPWLF